MTYWKEGKMGKRFLYGDDSPKEAELAALQCGRFSKDDDDECLYEAPITCYNCRYRRWTVDSFECLNLEVFS